MTRAEAIKTLHELWRETNDSWYEETYKMAIEALSEPSGDLISRADAVKAICDKCLEEHCETECIVPCTFMEALEAVPSSEAVPLRRDCTECALRAINRPKLDEESYERGYTAGQFAGRPKGLWTITTTDDGEGGEVPHLICSECGNEPMAWSVRQFFNFCPNCGADMRGEEE